MKRRLFIAINIDPQARRAIGKIEKEAEDAFGREWGTRIRFMSEENWHITISFLGTQDDASLTAIMEAARGAANRFPAPDISFAEVSYAPKKDNPRMIWIKTSPATSLELGEIKNALEGFLNDAGVRFEREARTFSGHITLARLEGGGALGGLPPVERKLVIHCTGASLDLVESQLDRGGAKYAVLQEFPFSKME